MKIYQIQINTMLLTIMAKNQMNAFNLLKAEDDKVFMENNTFKYKYSEAYIEDFTINEVPMKEGIVQWSTH